MAFTKNLFIRKCESLKICTIRNYQPIVNAQLKRKISIMMLAALAVVGVFACAEKVSAAKQGAAWEAAQYMCVSRMTRDGQGS